MPENRRNQRQRVYDQHPEQEGYETDEEADQESWGGEGEGEDSVEGILLEGFEL